MTKGVWRRVGDHLIPVSTEAREQLVAIKDGKTCVGDVHGARNSKQLALYWALCGFLAKNLSDPEHPITKDGMDFELRKAILRPETYYDMYYREREMVKSIAMESMPQAEFNEFFNMAIEIMARFLGAKRPELMDQFNAYLDGDVKRLIKEGYFRP